VKHTRQPLLELPGRNHRKGRSIQTTTYPTVIMLMRLVTFRNALIKALTGSLKTVQAATNTHLNRRVQISALSLPSTVHAVATKKIMRDAMIDIGFAPSEDLQSMEMPFAAHYAYDLGTAKGLGLEKGACDWDMGVYEAVLVDYNKDILSVLLLDLAEHGCVVRGEMNALELGEGAVSDGSSDSKQNAAQKPLVPEARIQSHYAAIQQKLEAFLSQETLLKESASNTGANWKPLRSDIRAVILAGDASLEGFDHLRSLLRETFADIPANGWLKDTIDPKDMAAIGAAKRIQHMANKPEDFHVHVQHVGHSHDEL